MLIVVALGGNALLRRGEPMTADTQRHNVQIAARALAPLAKQHQLVLSHGNGPRSVYWHSRRPRMSPWTRIHWTSSVRRHRA
jgi:carbamate kinase